MVLVIATEATLFLLLLATTSTCGSRPTEPGRRPARIPAIAKPLIATLLLVASSVPMAFAGAGRGSSRPRDRRGSALLAGLVLGVAFLFFQDVLIHQSLDRFGPRDNAYGSIYYTLLGLHAAHVAAGVLLGALGLRAQPAVRPNAIVTVG